MKVVFFKLPNTKKFDYQPRWQETENISKTTDKKISFKRTQRIEKVRKSSKTRGNKILFFALLIIILIYIIFG